MLTITWIEDSGPEDERTLDAPPAPAPANEPPAIDTGAYDVEIADD